MKWNASAVVTTGLRYIRCKTKMAQFKAKQVVTFWLQTRDTDFFHAGIQAFVSRQKHMFKCQL